MNQPSIAGAASARGIQVRPMKEEDVSAVLGLLGESPEAAAWSQGSLVRAAEHGNAWVAQIGDRVAGMLVARVALDEFEILNLAVEKASRRAGIGTHLAACALQAARKAGAARVYLEVRASNHPAIALYSRFGFKPCGERPNYYSNPEEDAVLLVLHIDGKN